MSQEASGLKSDRKKVLRNAALVASGTMTSRILGLFRDMALAALFDRTVTDAWTAAFRIPNLFRRLFGEGSLSVSFIPVFLQARAEEPSGERAQNLVNAFYTLLLIVMAAITVAGIIGADSLLRALLDESYLAIPGKFELTLRLAKIMFGFVFFICTYAYFMGIMNALGSFALPALAPTLFNVSMLLFTFMPGSWFALPADGLAWGVLIGGVLQALVLWVALKARGYLPRLSWHLWNADVKALVKGMVPGLIGMGLLQFSTLVNLHFASRLGEGAISYIYWADRLLELPLSLVAVSLGAALLPKLADLHWRRDKTAFQETLLDSFSVSVFLILPAAVGLFMLASPLVETLFLRGEFTSLDAKNTTLVLKIYALSMIFVSCSRVLASAFYAQKNSRLPALSALFSLLVHVGLAPYMMALYGLGGLIFSSLLGGLLNFVILSLAISLQTEFAQYLKLMVRLARIGVAVSVMTVFLFIWNKVAADFAASLKLLLGIVLGAGIYFGICQLLRVQELAGLWGVLDKGSPKKLN